VLASSRPSFVEEVARQDADQEMIAAGESESLRQHEEDNALHTLHANGLGDALVHTCTHTLPHKSLLISNDTQPPTLIDPTRL
jgi:hypothetical protein